MVDLEQMVEVKWNKKMRRHYEECGYHFSNYGDIFYVKAKHLSARSTIKVKVQCDYCGCEFLRTMDDVYSTSNDRPDACIDCKAIKFWDKRKPQIIASKFKRIRDICDRCNYELLTDESEYRTVHTKIQYVCPLHGTQETTIDNFLHGSRCPQCAYEQKGRKCRHSSEYIKSKIESYGVVLLNAEEYVGTFERNLQIQCECGNVYTTSFNDFVAHNQYRCAVCSQRESTGEYLIRKCLEGHNIQFVQEKRFDDCKDKNKLPFDFYLPLYNLVIEFDGKQHFEDVKYGNLAYVQAHDTIKNQYCKDHDIDILRIPYWEGHRINHIIETKLNL